MCDLCENGEDKKKAINRAFSISNDLEKLSHLYRHLANGKIKPHSDEIKPFKRLATQIIKNLVEDWV